MSAEKDVPLYGRGSRCEPVADDEIVGWVSGPARSPMAGEDASCPTCGYTGQMTSGPSDVTCPACLAQYPKFVGGRGLVLMQVRCAECGLAIGVTDDDRDRTIVCPRCKYFLGCVLHKPRRKVWGA